MLTVNAYAKINLTLEVLGRRADGYHNIISIIQTIDIHDILTLEPDDDITLACDRLELRTPENLVLKAARLLNEHTGGRNGAKIRLTKGIPISSGLGGGSSDAAATLQGLNNVWKLGLSTDDLIPLAKKLGSDVPFFLYGGTAMVQGRGERIRLLPPTDLHWMVVLAPAINLPNKTSSLYQRLTEDDFTKGFLTRKLEARVRGGGDVPPQFLFNAFDSITFESFPGLRHYWDTFSSLGAKEIHIAGSGPSMFAPVSHKEVGTALQLLLHHNHGWKAYLTTSVPRALESELSV